jgi:RHS repeat-associated protein
MSAPVPLDYMLARYYSSSLARFMAVDPSRVSVVPTNPQTWNRYSYAFANPLNLIDPDGKAPAAVHQQISEDALKGRKIFASHASQIAERTRTIDKDIRTHAFLNPKLHFGGEKTQGQLERHAVEAYLRGDIPRFIEYTARAMHKAEDVPYHRNTNYVLHAAQKVAGLVAPNADPDKQEGARAESEARAGGALDNIEAGIAQGGRLGGGSLEVEVDASRWRYYANKYAESGVTVYVDGVCYKNC